jgi:hypothetical protein
MNNLLAMTAGQWVEFFLIVAGLTGFFAAIVLPIKYMFWRQAQEFKRERKEWNK